MAIKTPDTFKSEIAPVLTFFNRRPVTSFRPTSRTASTTVSSTSSIFGFDLMRSDMILEALNSPRLCMSVTFDASLERYCASSMAVSPPPTTATGTLR